MKTKKMTKRFLVALCLLLVSATMLGTASFAWFSMNTQVDVDGIQIEAYSDSLFLEISDAPTGTYGTSLSLSSNGEKVLRLAKHGFVGKAYTLTIASGTGNYTGSGTYYEKIAETNDSYEKYIKVTPALGSDLTGLYKDLVFERITAVNAVSDGTTQYYELVADKYTPVTKASGVSVKGCYTLTEKTAETAGNYAGSGKFYKKDTDNAYVDITSTLVQGADLAKYFTITAPTEVTASTVAGTKIYLGNKETSPDEFAYYGEFTTMDDLTDALYFGRAYSDVITDGDVDDTLSIIKSTKLDSYRYYDTVYLRNAVNTNDAKDLKVDVTVGGATNNLASALRVVLVAKINDTVVNTATYENTGRTLTYKNGTNLVPVLLGNQAETLKVDIYVYFDGTDMVANNQTIPTGILDGQTVNLKFSIAVPEYNQTPVAP